MSKAKPITPSEVTKKKTESIPPEVFDAFNHYIARNLVGKHAVVKQEDVVTLIMEKLAVSHGYVFNNHLMDVEDSYREAGWEVEYDKPGYNESYPATFTFTIM